MVFPWVRSHSSMTRVLMEKPIQKAMPKNCSGVRWVRPRGGKENAHHWARRRDAEQDGDGAEHPALLLRAVAAA